METISMSFRERKRLEVFSRVGLGEMTLVEASEILRLSYRQTKRVWSRYKATGDTGLVHGGRGRPGERGAPRRSEGRGEGPGRPERFGPGGPGGPGVPGGGQPNLDPLTGMNNPRTPLYGRLLAVPELREKYLEHVRTIAQESLIWEKLGPFVTSLREMLEPEVKLDTRKLTSYEAFLAATDPEDSATKTPGDPAEETSRPVPPSRNLRMFIEQRSKFLLQ